MRVRALRAIALASVVGGCAPVAASPPQVTSVALPDAPREPDGVVLEPTPALPEAEERAPADGVVALRPPLGNDAVVTVVHRLFRAFARSDGEALQAIMTEDASSLGPARTHGGGRGTLLEQWRPRLKNPAYARLVGVELVTPDQITRFSYEDLGVAGAPERPPQMLPGDVLVRFPITAPRTGSEALFGDEMTLLLRRDGRTFKIAGATEENEP
jgi:hypothetical protein